MGRTKQLVGWRDGWPTPRQPEMDRPPTRDKFPQFYINSRRLRVSRRPDRPRSRAARGRAVGPPKKRAGEAGWRGNINIQFLLLIVIQIILSFLPRSPRSCARPMDGWIVDGWSIRGEWAGAGGLEQRWAPLKLLQAPPRRRPIFHSFP